MTVFSLAALFSIALKIADPTATSRGCAVSLTFLSVATATCILVVLGDFFNRYEIIIYIIALSFFLVL